MKARRMTMDYRNYPPDWKQISQRIRERDGDRCKWCGAPNGKQILRSSDNPADYIWYDDVNDVHCWPGGEWIRLSEIPEEYEFTRRGEIRLYTKVVLTVAHLDHDTANNTDDNLAALCQRCHLRHDARQHAASRAETRRAKFEQRQPRLLP